MGANATRFPFGSPIIPPLGIFHYFFSHDFAALDDYMFVHLTIFITRAAFEQTFLEDVRSPLWTPRPYRWLSTAWTFPRWEFPIAVNITNQFLVYYRQFHILNTISLLPL